MAKSYEMDMCNGPILRKVLTYSIPLMLSGVLQLLFNAADVIVVGRFAGSQSLAAVGSTSSLINLLINVFIGLSIGTNVLVARYYGAKNDRDMSETIHTAITVSLMSGLFLVFLGLFTSRFWLELMGTPDDVIDKSTIYMRIYFAGMPATMVYNFGSAILRAIGDTKRPLYFLTVAGVINAALNVFFVTQLQMDVAGVALATVISQCISAFLVIRCLMRSDGAMKLSLSKLGVNRRKLLLIIKVGLPAGIQGAIFAISNVLIQSSVNSFGSIAMAGNTASQNIEGFVYTSMNALYQTNLSFTSQNIGAEKYTRIKKILATCQGVVVTVGLVLGFAAYLGGPWLLQIYSEDARRYFLWTAPDVDHLYDVFPVRRDGYDGRKHPRTWVFDPADASLSDRRLRTASDLDLYHICSAAIAGDPVSVVPNLLGGHCDGTYDLLLAGGEEDAEGRWPSGAGIEFEKHKQDVIKK